MYIRRCFFCIHRKRHFKQQPLNRSISINLIKIVSFQKSEKFLETAFLFNLIFHSFLIPCLIPLQQFYIIETIKSNNKWKKVSEFLRLYPLLYEKNVFIIIC